MLTECRFPGGTLLCRRVRAEDPRVTAYASPGLALPPAADQAAETTTLHKGRHLMAHLGGHLRIEAATRQLLRLFDINAAQQYFTLATERPFIDRWR